MCVCVCESIQPLPFLSTLQAPLASHSPLSSICFTLHYCCMPYHSITLSLPLDSYVSLSLSVLFLLSFSPSRLCKSDFFSALSVLLPLQFPVLCIDAQLDWEKNIESLQCIDEGLKCRFWCLHGGILESLIAQWRTVLRLTDLVYMARGRFMVSVNMSCYLLWVTVDLFRIKPDHWSLPHLLTSS